ncbi:hypothetical protein CK203_074885 [Vitis vinifera]|uniref:Reverse transcriptase domain-containing protein n=1 Tax=Vitis vinifera TaxID=29760 RepID=A0A438DEA3_VITVI|nr:hypothetical protein CK203_074885 [Vitis vinifera]
MNKLLRIGPFHPYTAHIFGLHPVLGVQILDVALIANEATDSRLRSQRKGVVHKLDIEKAYEHVFDLGKWNILWFLSKFEGFKTRGSSIPLFICVADGGPQYSFEKDRAGSLHFKLQGWRQKRNGSRDFPTPIFR